MIYTWDEIESMPTLESGHFANLKFDGETEHGRIRIWRSRMTIEDGELDPIQVERLEGGVWVDRTRGPGAVYMVQGQGVRCGVRTPSGNYSVDRFGVYHLED